MQNSTKNTETSLKIQNPTKTYAKFYKKSVLKMQNPTKSNYLICKILQKVII